LRIHSIEPELSLQPPIARLVFGYALEHLRFVPGPRSLYLRGKAQLSSHIDIQDRHFYQVFAFHVRPVHEKEWRELVKMVKDAHEKAEPWLFCYPVKERRASASRRLATIS
jgi:hypothetical protein